MKELTVDLTGISEIGEDAEIIGLALQRPAGFTKLETWKSWEEAIREYWADYGTPLKDREPFMTVQLLCGKIVIYKTFNDIPNHSMRCPCGDPKHWIVKYTQAG